MRVHASARGELERGEREGRGIPVRCVAARQLAWQHEQSGAGEGGRLKKRPAPMCAGADNQQQHAEGRGCGTLTLLLMPLPTHLFRLFKHHRARHLNEFCCERLVAECQQPRHVGRDAKLAIGERRVDQQVHLQRGQSTRKGKWLGQKLGWWSHFAA
eukprot:363133-Chlamydomonas_euryale.AAC.7